jgi:ubiquinone/menaquinone biosynthesis C-methylase UbiE
MATNYDEIAAEYQRCKQQPWRLHIEYFTLFQLLGDLHGKAVLDLACGEGHYSRILKRHGAARVLGVDSSQRMIELAWAQESSSPLGIAYQVQDAGTLQLSETFDVVLAAYLLNYARTREQLLKMCLGIARSLQPGGMLVAVNSNPELGIGPYPQFRKYGFDRHCAELREGAPVTWTNYLEDRSFEVENYYLTTASYEWALQTAGLRQSQWIRPRLAPSGEQAPSREFWQAFLDLAPVIFLACRRAAPEVSTSTAIHE